jgi:hypothetical protein
MSQRVEFTIIEDGVDAEQLSGDSDLLLTELRELDFDGVGRLAARPAPRGTRTGDVATIASIVAIVSSPAVLQTATEVVKSWLVRRTRGSVRIKVGDDEIEISAASTSEQHILIAEFLARHRAANHGES